MLMTQLLSAQNIYPYKAVINGDTVGVFTIPQVRQIDTAFKSNEDCHQQLKYAVTENKICRRVVSGQQLLMNKYIEDSVHLKEITLNQDTLIHKQDSTIKRRDHQIKRIHFEGALKNVGLVILAGFDVFLGFQLYFIKPK